jgi:hypothetical protein
VGPFIDVLNHHAKGNCALLAKDPKIKKRDNILIKE